MSSTAYAIAYDARSGAPEEREHVAPDARYAVGDLGFPALRAAWKDFIWVPILKSRRDAHEFLRVWSPYRLVPVQCADRNDTISGRVSDN